MEEASGRYFLPTKCGGMSRPGHAQSIAEPGEEANWKTTLDFQMGDSFLLKEEETFDRNQDWESKLKSLAQCSVF